MNKVHMAVGSNLGNKLENCQKGIENLIKITKSRLIKCSPFYKTAPEYYEDQDWFVNGVFILETKLDYLELLKQAKKIEKDSGREEKTIRFGPRILDLDILLYDNIIIDSELLSIPHPRIHERRFVLQPFCDIDPDCIHPVLNKKMQMLLDELTCDEKKVIKIE